MPVPSKRLAATAVIVAGLLGSIGCRTDSPTSPANPLAPDQSPRFSTYDPSTKTLGLTINAGGRFTDDTYRAVSASVIGGNGTYYFQWFIQPCHGDYCDDQYLWDEGWGLSSTTLHLTRDMSWVKLSLQAFDSPNLPYSASDQVTLIGPTPQTVGPNFKCELGFDNYPIHNIYPDSGGVYSGYYRDGCTGARVYDPDHPKLPWEP